MKQLNDPIEAELFGSNECRYRGITTRGSAPVLALCRALNDAAYDPSRPLHVYRDKTLVLMARSIGDGAKLTVRDSSTGRPKFRKMTPQEWARAQVWRPALVSTRPRQTRQWARPRHRPGDAVRAGIPQP